MNSDDKMYAIFWFSLFFCIIASVYFITNGVVSANRQEKAIEMHIVQKYNASELMEKRKLDIKDRMLKGLTNDSNTSKEKATIKDLIESGNLDKFLEMEE